MNQITVLHVLTLAGALPLTAGVDNKAVRKELTSYAGCNEGVIRSTNKLSGRVNSTFTALQKAGYISKERAGGETLYKLTESGVSYYKNNLSLLISPADVLEEINEGDRIKQLKSSPRPVARVKSVDEQVELELASMPQSANALMEAVSELIQDNTERLKLLKSTHVNIKLLIDGADIEELRGASANKSNGRLAKAAANIEQENIVMLRAILEIEEIINKTLNL